MQAFRYTHINARPFIAHVLCRENQLRVNWLSERLTTRAFWMKRANSGWRLFSGSSQNTIPRRCVWWNLSRHVSGVFRICCISILLCILISTLWRLIDRRGTSDLIMRFNPRLLVGDVYALIDRSVLTAQTMMHRDVTVCAILNLARSCAAKSGSLICTRTDKQTNRWCAQERAELDAQKQQ